MYSINKNRCKIFVYYKKPTKQEICDWQRRNRKIFKKDKKKIVNLIINSMKPMLPPGIQKQILVQNPSRRTAIRFSDLDQFDRRRKIQKFQDARQCCKHKEQKRRKDRASCIIHQADSNVLPLFTACLR